MKPEVLESPEELARAAEFLLFQLLITCLVCNLGEEPGNSNNVLSLECFVDFMIIKSLFLPLGRNVSFWRKLLPITLSFALAFTVISTHFLKYYLSHKKGGMEA